MGDALFVHVVQGVADLGDQGHGLGPTGADQAGSFNGIPVDSATQDIVSPVIASQFYGYYTLDFSKDGKIVGMLSVNGYSGQIFLHTWHGTFIEEAQ